MNRILALFAFLILASCLGTPAMADPSPEPSATAQVLNHAIDRASDGLTQIAHALSSAAPQAWKLAVGGVYAKGLSTLIIASIAGGVALLGWAFTLFCTLKTNWDGSEFPPLLIPLLIVGAFAVILTIGALVNGLNSDAWARVISPDGYLAQQILTKALGQ